MAPARCRAWLVFFVFAGSQLLTDGHLRSSNDAGRGPEDAHVMLEVSWVLGFWGAVSVLLVRIPPALAPMLWGGLDLQADGAVRLRDEELASLRPARRLVRVLQEEVPKTPAEIELHLRHYSLDDSPLHPAEFDRLLLTGVYCAHQIRSLRGLEKNLWVRFFSQLLDETFRDLCKGLCPANTTLLLASWPWEEKPSHLASLKHFYPSNLARTKRST